MPRSVFISIAIGFESFIVVDMVEFELGVSSVGSSRLLRNLGRRVVGSGRAARLGAECLSHMTMPNLRQMRTSLTGRPVMVWHSSL